MSGPDFETLSWTLDDDGVATLVLDRPDALNAFTVTMARELEHFFTSTATDDEVRAVTDHWRAQGQPDYISSVTEEPEESFALEGAPIGEDSAEDQQYRAAIALVCNSQKASTSWVQRQLRIGYNSAARLIERMEKDGIVSRPDHVGRREVLRDQDGNPT